MLLAKTVDFVADASVPVPMTEAEEEAAAEDAADDDDEDDGGQRPEKSTPPREALRFAAGTPETTSSCQRKRG